MDGILSVGNAAASSSLVVPRLSAKTDRVYRSPNDSEVTERRFMLSAVNALIALLDLKDQVTGVHGTHMSNWALGMTKMLDLTPYEVEDIQIAATLHDIGKVGVPDAILKKDGPLNPDEWKIMDRHPEFGWAITKEIIGMERISLFILHHHEMYNGKGYPAGLKGEAIPLGSRIITILDCFDAMTHDRPYRKALSIEDSVKELKKFVTVQFDPMLVDLFANYILYSPPQI